MYPPATEICAALPGAPVAFATILMAAALVWFCAAACKRRRPAPRKAALEAPGPPGDDDPVAAQLALLAQEIADMRALIAAMLAEQRDLVTALAALQRVEEKTVYYTTAGGQKLHADGDCPTLANTAEIKELPLDADVAAFLYKTSAVCARCADLGPGPGPSDG